MRMRVLDPETCNHDLARAKGVERKAKDPPGWVLQDYTCPECSSTYTHHFKRTPMGRIGKIINLKKADARRERKLHKIRCEGCDRMFKTPNVEQETCPSCLESDHEVGSHNEAYFLGCSFCDIDKEMAGD